MKKPLAVKMCIGYKYVSCHMRPKVECDLSIRYNEGVLTSRMTMN